MPLHEGIFLQLEVPWGGPYDFGWAPNSMHVLVFRLRDGLGHSFGPSKLRSAATGRASPEGQDHGLPFGVEGLSEYYPKRISLDSLPPLRAKEMGPQT